MTSDQHADPVPIDPDIDPDEARQNPEDAVDALERRVLGGPEHRLDGGYPDGLSPDEQNGTPGDPESGEPDDETPRLEPAFEIDLDPEDEGSSAAAPRNPD